jgi:hypothetical protein
MTPEDFGDLCAVIVILAVAFFWWDSWRRK